MAQKHFTHNAEVTRLIHNVITRGLDNIITKSDTVTLEQLPDFFTYCEIWGQFLHDHHDHEEKLIFPCFTSIGGDKFVELDHELRAQHDSLIPSLEEFIAISKGTRAPEKVIRLKELAGNIKTLLLPHLRREEDTLCNLEFCHNLPDHDIGKMLTKLHIEVQKHPPEKSIAYVMYHLNPEEKVLFTKYWKIPWIVRKLLFPGWAKKHSSTWIAYAPYPTRTAGSGKFTFS